MTIKSEMIEPIPKYWMVTVNRKGDSYYRTQNIGVVAMDLISALNKIKEVHPDVIIVSANHRGPVNVLVNDLYKNLYIAVNEMLAELGAKGTITTKHNTVSDVMSALHDIDGGEYKLDKLF